MRIYVLQALLLFLTSSKIVSTEENIYVQRPTAYDREVVVDIEDSNKTQYHEQNFDTSK